MKINKITKVKFVYEFLPDDGGLRTVCNWLVSCPKYLKGAKHGQQITLDCDSCIADQTTSSVPRGVAISRIKQGTLRSKK